MNPMAELCLYSDGCYVSHGLDMACCNTVMPGKVHSSYGTAFFDHLAADRTGLTGSQVAVVTVSQVNANLLSSLHLELLHSSLCLGNIDLIIALHNVSLLLLAPDLTGAFPNLCP